MSHQHKESQRVEIYGGTGGPGGPGSGGGRGGDGYGPTLKVEAGTVHIVINHESKEIPRIEFLNWLSPINFFLRQEDILRVWQEGTGEWLLADSRFQAWKTGSRRTLWCHGIPGAGKTVLASIIVKHLSDECEKNKTLGVACIYLNHKEADNQTPPKLLAALWRQLVYGRDISSIAKNIYTQHQEKGTTPSLKEVLEVLRSSLEEFSKVFVVVDAIDEYPEVQRPQLLQYLAAIGSNINLIITSRPHIYPEPSFPNLETLDICATSEDIRKYVEAQISLSPRLLKHIQSLPELEEVIHSTINSQSVDGMFLLPKLHIESLSTKGTIKAVREALKTLPKNLHDSYDIVMQRIEGQSEEDRTIAHSTITWVANAKRPLTVQELQVALAVEPGTQQLDNENLMSIDTILSVCAGLVIVDKQLSVVRLVHYTTQEYLNSIQAQKFPDAQTEITRTLFTFLTFDGFPDQSWSNRGAILPPLVEYSQYCLVHAAGEHEGQLKDMITEFSGRAVQWKQTMNEENLYTERKWDSPPWNYPDWPSQPSALWIAAAANLVETTKSLLQGAPLLQDSASQEIVIASYYGYAEIICILVEKGANINAPWRHHGSLLEAAAYGGHTKIVHTLLDTGADANAGGWSPLQAAAFLGRTEIVHILLEKGANINLSGGEYGNALQTAANGGHTEIVRILLDKGANVNAAGGRYGSSLQAAAANGNAEIVCILLDKGANVNAAGGRYGSSLQAAAANGKGEIVHILVDKGATVNAAGGEYGSSLQAAAAEGYEKIACFLVERSADINEAEGEYGSLLQAASYRGQAEIVRSLIKKGVNVNTAGGEYGSPLKAAAYNGHTKIVRILVEHGANVNEASGEYGSLLQAATYKGQTEIVCILVENGANVNAAGGKYGSSLWVAAFCGHTKIVDILLTKGVEIHAAGEHYGTLLHVAAWMGHTETVCILLEKGADVNVPVEHYGTLLQAAAWMGRTEIVQILLEKGANINATGGQYGTALEIATKQGYNKIVSMLLKRKMKEMSSLMPQLWEDYRQ